jgi:hypothetical protein
LLLLEGCAEVPVERKPVPNWEEWKVENAHKLVHPMGFEARFVDLILSRIPIIDPSDIIPQFDFVDDRGRARRVDFMIVNEEKGYLLPVELDGFRKSDDHAESKHWNDFLERQNALVSSFGVVLRYSNAQMFNNGVTVRAEIAKTLSIQSSKKYAEAYVEAAIESVAMSAVAGVKTLETLNGIGGKRVSPHGNPPPRTHARQGGVGRRSTPQAAILKVAEKRGRFGWGFVGVVAASFFGLGVLANTSGTGLSTLTDRYAVWTQARTISLR